MKQNFSMDMLITIGLHGKLWAELELKTKGLLKLYEIFENQAKKRQELDDQNDQYIHTHRTENK